jgi:ATP-dependent DNA ligase
LKTTLYAIDNKGQVRVWSVEELGDGLMISHGVLNGLMQEKHESILVGLATRTLEEQMHSRAESRIKKKIDAGYCMTLEEAQNKPHTNSLGFKKPMLAAKFKDCKKIDYYDLFVQYKYDGNRMLVRNENGTNIAYTRNGKPIETIPEIIEQMIIPEGVTIDGEIYCHGESLQTIVSWVKRRQENSLKLRYHAYDVMVNDGYESRFSMLTEMELGDFAEVVPTYKYSPDQGKTIKQLLIESIELGYEGLILRQNDCSYETGKRSKSLIKVKQFLDDEFKITGMHLSKDGLPMLNLITDKGVTFKATVPGSMEQKHAYYADIEKTVKKWVRLEFSQWTKDDVPFHPTATDILNHKHELK